MKAVWKGGKNMTKREDYEVKTERFLQPLVEENHFELVDVEYIKEAGNWYLRAYIDKEGGITVDDCEVISRRLGEWLDEKDFIADSYILEVSSPGDLHCFEYGRVEELVLWDAANFGTKENFAGCKRVEFKHCNVKNDCYGRFDEDASVCFYGGELKGIFDSEDGKRHLVLSAGLGNTEVVPRFNNIPEIVCVDLVPEVKKDAK